MLFRPICSHDHDAFFSHNEPLLRSRLRAFSAPGLRLDLAYKASLMPDKKLAIHS